MDFTEGTHTSEVKIKWQYQSARLPRHAAISAAPTGNSVLPASLPARSATSRRCRITFARNAVIMTARKSSRQQNKQEKEPGHRFRWPGSFFYERMILATKTPAVLQGLICKWQRGWDSNPRWLLTTLDFESSTFDHSDTSPCSLKNIKYIITLLRKCKAFFSCSPLPPWDSLWEKNDSSLTTS